MRRVTISEPMSPTQSQQETLTPVTPLCVLDIFPGGSVGGYSDDFSCLMMTELVIFFLPSVALTCPKLIKGKMVGRSNQKDLSKHYFID